MPTILVINGPNLNNLGRRDASHYGTITLPEIEREIAARAEALGMDVSCFQSNHEGAIVDFIQEHAPTAQGIVINPAALTGVGYSITDALLDCGLPTIEVHLSNIHAREEFRRHSVVGPIATGQVAGLGWQGYLYALEHLSVLLAEVRPSNVPAG
ncbi:MAG: type II 3-dehydroquinate dehydratase [Dehalococcoidia bacterium]